MALKIKDVKVTSDTDFYASIKLRKALREYEYGGEASFVPGVGAFPTTRPGFIPTSSGKRAVHPDFKRNCDLIAELYYHDPVPISTSSYSIKKDAKIGLPYNDRSERAHVDFMEELLRGPMNTQYLGHYVYGTRIQTDSNKIRETGYVQLKAIGDGFQVQRHRMINAGPAMNHVLGIFEFDYHHRLLNDYAETFNVVVDEFEDTGYAYALDYKHYEHSLGWDVLFSSMVEKLRESKHYAHAYLFEQSNMNNYVHFRPTFSNRTLFDDYLSVGDDINKYAAYAKMLYGDFFGKDENVEKTMEAIRNSKKSMSDLFDQELACPHSPLSGYRIWHNEIIFNSSGVVTTATVGKLYSIADTMCRLTEAYGWKWDLDTLDKFLKHKLGVRVYNLGDDNLLFFDKPVDFQKFLDVTTGAVLTEELPVGFLSRLLTNEVAPHKYVRGKLNPKSASFFRKLSRERDIFSYKYPSIGFSDSLHYAERFPAFAAKENEIARLYSELYMSFYDILTDLQQNVDTEMDPADLEYIAYIDDRGKIFRDNLEDPSEILPSYYYAIDGNTRGKIMKYYGGLK